MSGEAEEKFGWVEEAKSQLHKTVADGDATRREATDEIDDMKPVEFVSGSMDNFHWEAAARDGDLIIHFFPVEEGEGLRGGDKEFGQRVLEVYDELLGGRREKLDLVLAPALTPSWIDPVDWHKEHEDEELPAYPSVCVRLFGYGSLEHMHKKLVDDALELVNQKVA